MGRTTVSAVPAEPPEFGYPPIDRVIEELQEDGRYRKARVLWQYFEQHGKAPGSISRLLTVRRHCVIVVGLRFPR